MTENDAIKLICEDLRITLENETLLKIQRIAEGYSNVSNKSKDVLSIDAEKEMLKKRIDMLEYEIKLIKTQIA